MHVAKGKVWKGKSLEGKKRENVSYGIVPCKSFWDLVTFCIVRQAGPSAHWNQRKRSPECNSMQKHFLITKKQYIWFNNAPTFLRRDGKHSRGENRPTMQLVSCRTKAVNASSESVIKLLVWSINLKQNLIWKISWYSDYTEKNSIWRAPLRFKEFWFPQQRKKLLIQLLLSQNFLTRSGNTRMSLV